MSEPSPYAIDFTPAARRGLARLPLSAATALHEHLTGPVAGNPCRWKHPLTMSGQPGAATTAPCTPSMTGSTPSPSWRLPTAVTPTGHGNNRILLR
jgi:hypothetical protein